MSESEAETLSVLPAVALQQHTRGGDLGRVYGQASPFPHIVLDGFLPPATARALYECFPEVGSESWIHYVHYNERKHGLNRLEALPEIFRGLIAGFNSPAFVQELERLTGIENLLPDPGLEGGGLHQSLRGGFLNIHADFTAHPHRPTFRRRVNVILYLNPGWQPEWGGHLELWHRDMSACARRIDPILNRLVVFTTDVDTYHGHPSPVACPEGHTRKSIALYYFTEESRPVVRSTTYRPRPGTSDNPWLIGLDTLAVGVYTMLKRRLGLQDGWTRWFRPRRKPGR